MRKKQNKIMGMLKITVKNKLKKTEAYWQRSNLTKNTNEKKNTKVKGKTKLAQADTDKKSAFSKS